MSNFIQHPYHLVDESPWPIFASVFSLGITAGLVKWFYTNRVRLLLFRLLFLVIISFQ